MSERELQGEAFGCRGRPNSTRPHPAFPLFNVAFPFSLQPPAAPVRNPALAAESDDLVFHIPTESSVHLYCDVRSTGCKTQGRRNEATFPS
jgi:hypothetical protein